MTATNPGCSVGAPVGSGEGVGVDWPAGVIGGGVSPPRMRKIGSVDDAGLGVGVGIGGGETGADDPGCGRGVACSWKVEFAAPGCVAGSPGVVIGPGEAPGSGGGVALGAGEALAGGEGAAVA